MKARIQNSARCFPAVLLFGLVPVSACAVDFDGYVFEDEAPPVFSEECVKFCDDQEEICGFEEEFRYASKEDCLTLCAGYFESELRCRETHLQFAIDGPATHCPHTIEDGGNTCPDARINSCDRFCLRTSIACPFDDGEDSVYPSARACDDACADFSLDGLECRFVELGGAEEADDGSQCENLLPVDSTCP